MIDNGNPHANGNGAGHGVAELVAPPAPVEAEAGEPSPETLLFRTGLLSPDQLGELVQERVGSGRSVEEIVVERGWLDADTVARALGHDATAASVPVPVAAVEPHPDPFAIPVVDLAPQPRPELQPEPQPEHHHPIAAESAIASFTPAVVSLPVEPVAVEPVAVEPVAFEPVAVEAVAVEPAPFEPVAVVPEQQVGGAVEFRVSIRFAGNECVEIASHADAVEAKAAAQTLVAQLSSQGADWPFVAGRFVRPDAVLSVDVDAFVR